MFSKNGSFKLNKISTLLIDYIEEMYKEGSDGIIDTNKIKFDPIISDKIKKFLSDFNNYSSITILSQTIVNLDVNKPTSSLWQQNFNNCISNCKTNFSSFVIYTFISQITVYVLINITNFIDLRYDFFLNYQYAAIDSEVLYTFHLIRQKLFIYLFDILRKKIKWDSNKTLKVVINFINSNFCYKFKIDSSIIYIKHDNEG